MKLVRVILMFFLLLGISTRVVAQQNVEQMASYYYQNGEFDKAIELYKPLLEKTTNVYYYQALYNCYMELEQYKEAEKLVERRIKQFPKDLWLNVDLGAILERKGDKKKAVKVYESPIEKLSYDSRQISDLAQAYEKVNHPEYAIKTYLFLRQKMNNRFMYVNELAALYERVGDYESMTQEYFDYLDESPSYISSVQVSLQRALRDATNSKFSEGLKQTIVHRLQKEPGNKVYNEMMLWYAIQQRDFNFAFLQAKSIDMRFPENQGEQVMRVAEIATSNGDYNTAGTAYGYIVKKGPGGDFYFPARVGLLEAEFARLKGDYAISRADVEALELSYQKAIEELGKNLNTVSLMRNYANILAYHDNKIQEAADLLYDIIELPKLSPRVLNQTKLELGDLLLFAGENWEASLLYMQVEKANREDVLGALAKFKNAKLSYYTNDFQWAKSQLDVLRASTSKLIANDAMELSLLISDNMEEDSTYEMLELYASADLLLYRNLLDSAWNKFDEITHKTLSHPLFDEILLQKAKIRAKQGRFLEADSLLQKLVDFYPTDITVDDALFMMAELNENQLNNKVKAKECYEKIILDHPTSLFVDQARKRYAVLR